MSRSSGLSTRRKEYAAADNTDARAYGDPPVAASVIAMLVVTVL